MRMHTHLRFKTNLAKKKPETIINREATCPFCNLDPASEEILARDGSILLVKNKYPVLEDTFQTVLIETDLCESDLSVYPKDHLYRLIRFGVEKWLEMERSGEYSSVLFYKNHGPLSGGTIAHPHMQIIGLKNVDYKPLVDPEHFEGLVIDRRQDVELNVSTKPKIGFYEFNVILHELDHLPVMADYIQAIVHYLLNHFHYKCNSYNLFFYHLDGKIMVKIVSRFVTTPLFIGFSIPQVPNNLNDVASRIQQRYFSKEALT